MMTETMKDYIHISEFAAAKKISSSFAKTLISNGDYDSKEVDGEIYVLYQAQEETSTSREEPDESNLNVGETVLHRGFGLTLTNYRIIDQSNDSYGSVTLDSLSSCYVTKNMSIKALIVGVVALIFSVLMFDGFKSGAVGVAIVGIASLMFFFATLKNVLRLKVHGATNYDYAISGGNLAPGIEFVEAFTTAKLNYLGKIK